MERITGANIDPNANGVGRAGFSEAAPGSGIPTTLTPEWANDVQEEIISVIAAAGITLDGGDQTQLLQAIIALSSGAFSTGDVKPTFKTTADSGWVMMNDGTIGSAASGATTRADDDTQALYELLWNNVTDTWAPVSGGRGASAAADFNADKPMALPKALGRALAVAGAGASLSNRTLGETLGAETHALTEAELAAHKHFVASSTGTSTASPALDDTETVVWRNNPVDDDAYKLNGAVTAADVGLSSETGNGDGHNNMQPTTFLNIMVKL